MNNQPITTVKKLNYLQKTWAWLRAVDEAVNYDPNEQLHQRVELLEAKLKDQNK